MVMLPSANKKKFGTQQLSVCVTAAGCIFPEICEEIWPAQSTLRKTVYD